MARRALQIFFGLLLLALIVFVATRKPARPALPRWQAQEELLDRATNQAKTRERKSADVALVKGLLKEDLSHRTFDFGVIVEAVSGKRLIPMHDRKSAKRVIAAINRVMDRLLEEMNAPNSPINGLRRINEGSRFFEDGIHQGLDAEEGITCGVPQTRRGVSQRSGYPDLKITDEQSGDIYYLDPKLMEHGSVKSSLRTFYFEPKDETLKITDDATHLLIGIEHDGNDGKWKFLGYRLVDLSGLKVRLKAEFQASNKDVYSELSVLESSLDEGKDSSR